MAETKKPRKTRSDKGKKRGKRGKGIKNPRLQIGSIDFRTIGTQQIMGPNLTSLIGTLSSLARPIAPHQPEKKEKSIQEIISTELARYAPRDLALRQNIPPPPQEKPDVEQAQEELSIDDPTRQIIEQMRRQQGNVIRNIRESLGTDIENLEDTNYFLREYSEGQDKYLKDLLKKEEAKKFLAQKVSGIRLQQEKERAFIAMDKAVELEGERQKLENLVQQYQKDLEKSREEGSDYYRQTGTLTKELKDKEERLAQTQTELSSVKQRMDEDISKGLSVRDEQLKQAESMKKQLEDNLADLRAQNQDLKANTISKVEFEINTKSLKETIQNQKRDLKYVREQIAEKDKMIGKQFIEKQQLDLRLLQTEQEKEFVVQNIREESERFKEQNEFQRDQFEEERQSLKAKIIEANAQTDLLRQFAQQQEEEYNEEARVSNEIVGMMAEDLLQERNQKILAKQHIIYQDLLLKDRPRVLFEDGPGYTDIINEEEHQQLMRELQTHQMPDVRQAQEENIDIDAINTMLAQQANERDESWDDEFRYQNY